MLIIIAESRHKRQKSIRYPANAGRALLLEIDRRHGAALRQRFERLEGEFAVLSAKHFGLFKVRRPRSLNAEDWHWTVAEIEEEPSEEARIG